MTHPGKPAMAFAAALWMSYFPVSSTHSSTQVAD